MEAGPSEVMEAGGSTSPSSESSRLIFMTSCKLQRNMHICMRVDSEIPDGLVNQKKKIIGVREQVQEQGTCHRLNVCLTALFSIHTWEQSVTHICLDTSALCNISMV